MNFIRVSEETIHELHSTIKVVRYPKGTTESISYGDHIIDYINCLGGLYLRMVAMATSQTLFIAVLISFFPSVVTFRE